MQNNTQPQSLDSLFSFTIGRGEIEPSWYTIIYRERAVMGWEMPILIVLVTSLVWQSSAFRLSSETRFDAVSLFYVGEFNVSAILKCRDRLESVF